MQDRQGIAQSHLPASRVPHIRVSSWETCRLQQFFRRFPMVGSGWPIAAIRVAYGHPTVYIPLAEDSNLPQISRPVMFDTRGADGILSALEVFPPEGP